MRQAESSLLRQSTIAGFQMHHASILTKQTFPCSKLLFVVSVVFLLNDVITAQNSSKIIGAVINANTYIGKQEKIAMEIAVQDFNHASGKKNKLLLYVSNSAGQPHQASTAADDLIEHKQVQAIVGLETWLEAASVAAVANEAKVPVLSFAPPSVGHPSTSERWPYLINMGSDISLQIKCIASIVGYYKWSRVIAIYEGQGYITDSGMLTRLSDELQAVGSEIEHWIVFPSFVSLAERKTNVEVEMKKLKGKKSRVFIIVGLSVELASYVLLEAKRTGLMGNHSVWFTTDTVPNVLDTVKSTVVSSMQGIIGIKTHFSDTSPSFLSFSTKFRSMFLSNYPEQDKYEPGLYALQAYDSISSVAYALGRF